MSRILVAYSLCQLLLDWVPKLMKISFKTIVQKLVQRCETKVNADACKASYCVFMNVNMFALVCSFTNLISIICKCMCKSVFECTIMGIMGCIFV